MALIRRHHAATAHRQILGVAAGHDAAGVMDHYRDIDIDTNGFPHLPRFTRHGNRRQQEDQAVDPPPDVQSDNVGVRAKVVMANRPDDADDHPQRQQTGHHQVRTHHGEIEVADVQQAALIGDVEFAAFGENHRHQGRQHQVESQHNVVDFPPEAVAIAAVHSRTDVDGEKQVRQRIGDDQAR